MLRLKPRCGLRCLAAVVLDQLLDRGPVLLLDVGLVVLLVQPTPRERDLVLVIVPLDGSVTEGGTLSESIPGKGYESGTRTSPRISSTFW